MKKYTNFSKFFQAFISGKIAVECPGGGISLYRDKPDMKYWEKVLQEIWNNCSCNEIPVIPQEINMP